MEERGGLHQTSAPDNRRDYRGLARGGESRADEDQVLAGQRRGAVDADFQRGRDFGIQSQLDFVFADDAKRMFEMNLLLVDDNLKLVLELVGDGTGGDRAEHFAIFTGFCRENERHPGQAFCQFAHGVELMRFALSAALSDDPFLTFALCPKREGTLKVVFSNNRGQQLEATHQVRFS